MPQHPLCGYTVIHWMGYTGYLFGSLLCVFCCQMWIPKVTSIEKEMATRSSILAWRIPGTVEPDGLPFMGLHRVGDD